MMEETDEMVNHSITLDKNDCIDIGVPSMEPMNTASNIRRQPEGARQSMRNGQSTAAYQMTAGHDHGDV